jgi:hypothetical protein
MGQTGLVSRTSAVTGQQRREIGMDGGHLDTPDGPTLIDGLINDVQDASQG